MRNGPLYVSENGGTTWAERVGVGLGSKPLSGIACSNDGRQLVACAASRVFNPDPDFIYFSSDFGLTWGKQDGPGYNNWTDLFMSEDGAHVHVVASALDEEESAIYTYTS